MKYQRKKRKINRATNAIDGATTKPFWGKKKKDYRLHAGKGGATKNAPIPEWIFDRELKEYKEGTLNA